MLKSACVNGFMHYVLMDLHGDECACFIGLCVDWFLCYACVCVVL